MEEVVLVDLHDNPLGTMEKMEAHEKGLLHRAFSVLLFNSMGEILLQQRALEKYHSGGLWTNACCSHPRTNESVEDAAQRRLVEEMGISLRPSFLYSFIYRAELNDALIEHEFDHVLVAEFNGTPEVNPEEVNDWKYVDMDTLARDMELHPERYTEWFKLIMASYQQHA